MTTYGFIDGSLVRKPASVIRTERNQLFQSVFGEDLNIAPTSPEGNLIGAESEREGLIWELLQAVYSSQYIGTASGASLDNAVAYLGLGRIASRQSTVVLTLATIDTGSDVTIASGSQAKQGTTSVLWETLTESVIPAATNVVEGVVTDIEYQSANTIRYTFSASISGVTVGDVLYLQTAANSTNKGLFSITAVGADYVDVENLNRSDTAADETTVTLDAVITDGVVTVDAQTVTAGAFSAIQNSINLINNPSSGWDYVGNMVIAEEGRATETDTELRARARANQNSASGGTISAIKARMLEVEGVTFASIRENRTDAAVGVLPPHSFELVLIGGDNQDIADRLYQIKGAGIETYGTTSVSVTDDFGVSQTVKFSRPSQVDIYLIVNVTTNGDYPIDGDDQIKAALVTYGATLTNGADVLNFRLIDAIAAIPGLLTIEILQGLSDPPTVSTNISIETNEIADISTDKIVVNS